MSRQMKLPGNAGKRKRGERFYFIIVVLMRYTALLKRVVIFMRILPINPIALILPPKHLQTIW